MVNGALDWREHPDPLPGPHQVLVAVEAAGINAADLLQRAGFYPAPQGVPPDIPGLEMAGRVVRAGTDVTRFSAGDRVMALLGGGAQAELAAVDEDHAMAVPDKVTWEEAGGFPEAYATAYDALFTQCGLSVGDRVLVTGAAGGVGSAAVQLAASAGAEVVASVRHPELRDAVGALGAAFVDDHEAACGRGPFDVVLELVTGPGFATSAAALGTGGRLSVIGIGAGGRVELDLLALMGRRAQIRGSTLRARSHAEKASVIAALGHHVVPLLSKGRVRVLLAAIHQLADATAAYRRFESGGKLGKVVLSRRSRGPSDS